MAHGLGTSDRTKITDPDGTLVGSEKVPLQVDGAHLLSAIEELTDEVKKFRRIYELVTGESLED